MANEGRTLFDWLAVADYKLAERYDWLAERWDIRPVGYERFSSLREFEPTRDEWFEIALDLFRRGLANDEERKPSARDTVFISHRQADYALATRAARRLNARGIDTWLDIEDPDLNAIAGLRDVPRPALLVLTALIIEMALLNSTHVLALLTRNTPGSMWVPYEYGRVKRPAVRTDEAASLLLSGPARPEYMLLGKQFTKLDQLDDPGWP